MRKQDKAVLIAMVLGDGYISKPKTGQKSCGIRLVHSIKQKEYIEAKAAFINSVCGGRQNEVREINNNGYPGVIYTKSHKYFRVLRKALYKNNKKIFPLHVLERITPQAFAILWMDDGSLYPKRRKGKIHAWEGVLSLYEDFETCDTFASVIYRKFGVRPLLSKHKGRYRLVFNTTKLRLLLPQIEEYSVPCMKYKFTMQR